MLFSAHISDTGPLKALRRKTPQPSDVPGLRSARTAICAPFTAGAHVDVSLPNGLTRQYSLTNDPDERHRYVLGVKCERDGRGGSRSLFDDVAVGDLLEVSEPRNTFPLVEDGSPIILIAGGIGVTPIRSMAFRIAALGLEHKVHYAVRSRSEAAFALPGVSLHVDDEAGALLDLSRVVADAPANAHLYCCGPAPMLAAFEAACAERPAEQVHVEHFGPVAPPSDSAAFTVELARSGRRVPVAPGQSILDALRGAGLSVMSSCEQGVCGTCETRVIAGVPEHRDLLLSAVEKAANNTMMICCSGSLEAVLVLDL